MAKVPPFPLWEVISAPETTRLGHPAIGMLLVMLGNLWASGDMALPATQTAVQALARAPDAQWHRSRENLLVAYRSLAPWLSVALAGRQTIQAQQVARMEHARASRKPKTLTYKPIVISSTPNHNVRDSQISNYSAPNVSRHARKRGRGDSQTADTGLAIPHGQALTRAEVAAQRAPATPGLRD